MIIPFIYLSLIAGMGLILWGVFGSFQRTVRVNLPQERPELKPTKTRLFLSYVFPFSQKLLERVRLDVRLKNRLEAGHVNLRPHEFFNLKLLLAVLFAILSLVFLKRFELWMLVVMVLGFVIPDLWLDRKIARRKYNIVNVLPETVDLLGLCVEAGLDFTTSIKWLIKKVPANPMLEELTFVLEQIEWGKPRDQALKDMAKRLNIGEITSFAQTLIQAERMGAPVTEAFTILSEDTRLHRFNRGERIAIKAPIKMLIPLVFCILPVIGIVIAGPILLQFLQGSLFKGF